MKLTDLRDYLARELDYPIDAEAALDRVGETTLEAPDADDSRTIGELLREMGDQRYDSADELFESILANAPDAYIGRKYYDDRGPNIDAVSDRPDDERDQSV